MSSESTDRLTYLMKGELREEIAYAVGANPGRYGVDSTFGFRKADMIRIADQLQPADSDVEIRDCTLDTLYEFVCRWAGGEYQPNAGNPWGINRPNLKKIHRAVDAGDPREVIEA